MEAELRAALERIVATRNTHTFCRRHGGTAFDEADPDSCVCSLALDAEERMRAIAAEALAASPAPVRDGGEGLYALLDEFDRYASVPDQTGYVGSPFEQRVKRALAVHRPVREWRGVLWDDDWGDQRKQATGVYASREAAARALAAVLAVPRPEPYERSGVQARMAAGPWQDVTDDDGGGDAAR